MGGGLGYPQERLAEGIGGPNDPEWTFPTPIKATIATRCHCQPFPGPACGRAGLSPTPQSVFPLRSHRGSEGRPAANGRKTTKGLQTPWRATYLP